jgi:hypothetical protein
MCHEAESRGDRAREAVRVAILHASPTTTKKRNCKFLGACDCLVLFLVCSVLFCFVFFILSCFVFLFFFQSIVSYLELVASVLAAYDCMPVSGVRLFLKNWSLDDMFGQCLHWGITEVDDLHFAFLYDSMRPLCVSSSQYVYLGERCRALWYRNHERCPFSDDDDRALPRSRDLASLVFYARSPVTSVIDFPFVFCVPAIIPFRCI